MADLRKRKKHSAALEEDATAHLWAVSYADLLMVMLSFFVLYFNPDEKAPPPPPPPPPSHVAMMIDKIAPQLNHLFFGQALTEQVNARDKSTPKTHSETTPAKKDKNEGVGLGIVQSASSPGASGEDGRTDSPGRVRERGPGQGVGPDSVPAHNGASPLPAAIRQSIVERKLNVLFEAQEDDLVIHFVEDAYAPGAFDVTEELAPRLKELLSAIAPYRDSVVITFIGHSDSRPLSSRLKKKVFSNMVLSSMRAASAAEFAEAAGFDPREILTQGTGTYGRNSRTLTVRISERPKK